MFLVHDLLTEYAPNPLGIGTAEPRFSWQLSHSGRGQRQTAYRILAARRPDALSTDGPDLAWDSGKVASPRSVGVRYGGSALTSRERIYWRVMCWDAEDRPSPWSDVAWCEVGLLQPSDWQASWIGYPVAWPGRALYFRRQFDVTEPVARARLYICGLGYAETFVNGTRLGDAVLDPAYTDVSKRVMYRTFDVGPLLSAGPNVLAVTVGNGWHGSPRLLAQLESDYVSGNHDVIATADGYGWFVSCGPVLEHSIYGGEIYDARQEKPGWNLPLPGTPPEGAGGWATPHAVAAPAGALTAQMIEPIRITDEIAPAAIGRPRQGVYVADLGQNIAGWVQLHVRGPRGAAITLRFAEMLYADGTVNQENLREVPAVDTYILKGEGDEVWEPRFTYHGFRYVQIEGFPGDLPPGAILGKVVRSSPAATSEFECSSELLNRIQRMVWWTERDNQHGIPTDCPQRNERMGWLNDMTARAEEAFFNFNMARFMAKWIADIHDAQDPITGGVPLTAPPSYMAARTPTEPVSVSYLETSWLLYAHYGDRRTLESGFEGYQKWLERMSAQATDFIVDTAWVADWAPPLANVIPGTLSAAPPAVMGTGFYYYGARLAARMAGILDRAEDRRRYESLAEDIAQAFNARFYDPATGGYALNNQSCNSFALWLGLVPAGHVARVVDNLVSDVVAHDYHLTTGNVCTKYLLEALAAFGHADVALRIATQTTYPSWGYMLANDATTLWERWEKYEHYGMNSHNHPMMGSVSSWLAKMVGGISVTPDTEGFDLCRVQPALRCGLAWARTRHQTVRGPIECEWRSEDSALVLSVTVPVNAAADVTILLGSSARIWESGVVVWDGGPAAQVEGISFAGAGSNPESEGVTFRAGSGRYEFRVDRG